MAARRLRRFLDRWVTPGAQKMLLGMAIFSLLAFACWVPLYRYSASRRAETPEVDLPALQARAAREQPVGGTETETMTFLRSLGFEDRNIRIKRYADTGRLAEVNGRIPALPRARRPDQILAHCSFDKLARLEKCYIWRGVPMTPTSPTHFVEATPASMQPQPGVSSSPGSL